MLNRPSTHLSATILLALLISSCARYNVIDTPGYLHRISDTVGLHSRPSTPTSHDDAVIRPDSMRFNRTAVNYEGETYYEVTLPSGTWWVYYLDALPTYEYRISRIS